MVLQLDISIGTKTCVRLLLAYNGQLIYKRGDNFTSTSNDQKLIVQIPSQEEKIKGDCILMEGAKHFLPSPKPLQMATLPLPEQPQVPLSYLTIDVIFTEILPKLPVKSLLRFKPVSKSFYTFISSPEFACLHLRHCPSSLFVRVTNRTLYSFDLDSLSSVPSTALIWPEGTISIKGSCNGLLLLTRLSYNDLSLVILNPFTQTYLDVQLPAGGVLKGNVGFGFDRGTNDYKIVLFSDNATILTNAFSKRSTRVYSVRSKSWRVVDETLRSDTLEQSYGGVLIENHLFHWCNRTEEHYGGVLIDNHLLHWMSYTPSNYKRRISCFDVCTETWTHDLLFPDYDYDPSEKNSVLNFGVFDGHLYSTIENPVNSCLDIWVMKEYGVQESWNKSLSVPLTNYLYEGVAPIANRIATSSEVLVWQRNKAKLIWYNTEDSSSKESEAHNYWDIQPRMCKTSLVILPGAKRFESAQIKIMHDG